METTKPIVGHSELILICLVIVGLLAIVARRIRVPHPILLTIGGVLLGLIPALPVIHLAPELVFNLFLPPLIYPGALFTSWRDFRANLRPILLLAIVLVVLTMTVIAALFHYLTGLPWAVGFVFGALISPPDAVAALSITQNLRVPRRIIVILEGESLVNDATSFISFRFAVAAVMTGAFSLGQATLQFLFAAVGGVAVGLAVGWLATQVQKRLDDPPVQTMFSLLTPYIAYFGGDKLHVSGILAVVIAGIYYGWEAPRILRGRMRLQALPVWEMVVFILSGMLFMMFFHRFEQGALRLRGCAIHFIDQHHLRKEWSLMKDKALLLAIENRIAQDISRQQVAGKLNPLKSGADRPGQRLRQSRLTNSRDIFDQQMTARE